MGISDKIGGVVAIANLPLRIIQPYGSFWARVVAYFIDSFIVGGSIILFQILVTGVSWRQRLFPDQPLEPIDYFFFISTVILSWLYYALMESSIKQGTLGKMALGLKVTTIQGSRISFARATGRHFSKGLGAITIIGVLMIAWTKYKQGLHDKIAGTLIYKYDYVPVKHEISLPPLGLDVFGRMKWSTRLIWFVVIIVTFGIGIIGLIVHLVIAHDWRNTTIVLSKNRDTVGQP